MSKRTQKDEEQYIAQIVSEYPIMLEVIAELRAHNRTLLLNQVRMLEANIRLSEDLAIYRQSTLSSTQRALDSHSHCVPNCTKHDWDDVLGWIWRVK